MDYAAVRSRASHGLDAPQVRVEVHISSGLPAFTVVGMPETAVRESRDRVRSALINSFFAFPDGRITVNLAPADLPKGGGRFDLPIALGILSASGQLPADRLADVECLGELALDGSVRDVRGAMTAVMAASAAGRRVALPEAAASRCALVSGARLLPAADLLSLCAVLRGQAEAPTVDPPVIDTEESAPDLRDVIGQRVARRALEIAAAGGHNLLMCGPPGTGKSLLASCLPGILPPAGPQERLVMYALQDLGGEPLKSARRPFRCPHHSASAAALIGGGALPRPGEASLAHGGVLFLDELPEFPRHALDMLREPLETGEIRLARARCRIRYPARFQLVGAMNPCPCGFAGDEARRCRCSDAERRRYAGRVSGPLLDRMDLQIRVAREEKLDFFSAGEAESSAAVLERTSDARQRQLARQGVSNAELRGRRLIEVCGLTGEEQRLVERATQTLHLSKRAVERSLRVALTIADLGRAGRVDVSCLREALAYRAVTDGVPADAGAG